MDALNQLRDMAVKWVIDMPVRTRLVAGLLLTVTVVGLACVVSLRPQEQRVELLQGIATPPNRLPAMEIAFAKAGLDDYVIERNQFRVLRSEKSRYVAALADAQLLPPNIDEILGEAIRAGGPFDTALQRAERIKNARQRQLALIISSMHGIDNAMVIYDEGEARGIRRQSLRTASVSVTASDGQRLSGERVRTIRHLVAAAIAGLEPGQISVTDLNTGRNFPAGPDAASDLTGQNYSELKSSYERQWTEKIHAGLSWVPGIVVSVDVALHSDAAAATQSLASKPQWTPKAVKVALSVPNTYVDEIWHLRQGRGGDPTATKRSTEQLHALQAQVAADLRSHVANLIPRERAEVDARLDVRLTFFDVLDSAGEKIVVAQYPDDTTWSASLWQFIALGLVAAVGMIALRRFHAAGRSAAEPSHQTDLSKLSGNENDDLATASSAADNGEPQSTASRESTPSATPTALFDLGRSVTLPGQQFSSRLVPAHHAAGIELNDLTTSRLAHETVPADADIAPDRDPTSRPFQFVDEASHGDLADLLIHENAQIIAIVFSHLEADHAAAVLKQLPSSLQVDVLRRLSDLDDLSDEVIREIERSLEARLTAQLHRKEKRNAGIRAVGSILGAVDDEARQTILGSLKSRHGDLAQQLQPAPTADFPPREEKAAPESARDTRTRNSSNKRLTFEDVSHLGGDDLCLVLSAAGTRDALLALSGAQDAVIDRLVGSMKPSEADRLRTALARLGPTSPGDVLASQRLVAEKASKLNASGRFQQNAHQRRQVAA